MTASQKLTIRASEIRMRLNEIAGMEGDALTDEVRAEETRLQTEYRDTETRLRAAVAAEPDPDERTTTEDSETRERRALRAKCGIADYVRAAVQGTVPEGAAAEYRDSLDIPARGAQGVNLPLAVLDTLPGAVETRAVTAGPATDGPPEAPIGFVFQRMAATSLGVMFPSHGPGQAQIPRVTAAPPADTLAKDADAPSTAATITLDTRSPERVSGQFEIRVEDLAVYPPLEMTLAEEIRKSVGNELDGEVINDLFNVAADVSAASAVETYATGRARFAGLVEGTHAYGYGDIRAIIGSSTFALYDGLYQANGDMSLADVLMAKLASFRVSNRVPAVGSNAQKGLVTRMASGDPIRVYVWNAIEMLRDPFLNAKKGQVIVTATALYSPVHVPHGTSQVVEVHPKLS